MANDTSPAKAVIAADSGHMESRMSRVRGSGAPSSAAAVVWLNASPGRSSGRNASQRSRRSFAAAHRVDTVERVNDVARTQAFTRDARAIGFASDEWRDRERDGQVERGAASRHCARARVPALELSTSPSKRQKRSFETRPSDVFCRLRGGLGERGRQVTDRQLAPVARATVPELDDAIRGTATHDDDRRHAEQLGITELDARRHLGPVVVQDLLACGLECGTDLLGESNMRRRPCRSR